MGFSRENREPRDTRRERGAGEAKPLDVHPLKGMRRIAFVQSSARLQAGAPEEIRGRSSSAVDGSVMMLIVETTSLMISHDDAGDLLRSGGRFGAPGSPVTAQEPPGYERGEVVSSSRGGPFNRRELPRTDLPCPQAPSPARTRGAWRIRASRRTSACRWRRTTECRVFGVRDRRRQGA